MDDGLRLRRRTRLLTIGALGALLLVAAQRMDLARALALLGDVDAAWLALAAACYLTILPLWALQWHLLAPAGGPRTWRDMLGVVTLTSGVLNTTPMLVGEVTAVVLLVSRAGVERAAALSVLAMDQLLVGVAKIVVLATAALAAPLPPWMARSLLALLAALVVLGGTLVIAAWRHADVAAALEHVVPRGAARVVGEFAAALEPLRSPLRGAPALGLALLKKAAEIGAIVCVQRAFGVHLPVSSAVLVLAALNLATLLPVVPGNVGVFEGAIVLVLTSFGITPEVALGIAVVQHLCYFAALGVPGLVAAARVR